MFDRVCVRSKPFTLSTNHSNFLRGTSVCPVESFLTVTLWNVTVDINESTWLLSSAAVQFIYLGSVFDHFLFFKPACGGLDLCHCKIPVFFRVIALSSMKAAYRSAAHFDTSVSQPTPPPPYT